MLDIVRRLEDAGFETWCVGGAVRDALLGHPNLDWDIATAATPQQVRRLFRRTIPVGIEFGTVGVLDEHGTLHEVTTFRRDVKTDGRHAVVEFGASLDEDLARRDFTINAIAYSSTRKILHDPFGGRDDLERRIVRAVGVANERMREDRLRALRAVRFASRFGFEIEPATWRAIVDSAPHLGRLSMERVKQELEKTMDQVECPSRALTLWRESGALRALIPSLAEVSDLTLASLDELQRPQPAPGTHPERRINRLTALFAELEPGTVERATRALRFSNADVAWISGVLSRWRAIEPELLASLPGADLEDHGVSSEEGGRTGPAAMPGDPSIRRWVGIMGRTRSPSVLRIAAARFAAARALGAPAPSAGASRALYRRAMRIAFRDPVEIGDLAIDGDDLRSAGIPPGPALGQILQRLLDDVLENPERNTGTWLIDRASALYNAHLR